MSAPLLSEPRQSLRVCIALLVSALLHFAAVAVAELKREAPSERIEGPFIEIPVIGTDLPDPIDPTPAPTPTEPSPPVRDENLFPEPATPPTPPAQSRQSPPRIVRPPSLRLPGTMRAGSAKHLALIAPRPEYPYEARRAKITGDGVALMTIDPGSGRVTAVTMMRSTGSVVLDQATIAALRRWRFRPGTAATIGCPITYTLAGASL